MAHSSKALVIDLQNFSGFISYYNPQPLQPTFPDFMFESEDDPVFPQRSFISHGQEVMRLLAPDQLDIETLFLTWEDVPAYRDLQLLAPSTPATELQVLLAEPSAIAAMDQASEAQEAEFQAAIRGSRIKPRLVHDNRDDS
jgi:hypothetical protein